MRMRITAAAIAATTVLATSAFAQTAREIRGASPFVPVKNEPGPKLIVDPPLPEGLVIGVYWAQYRVENLRIVQVFGPEARQVSPGSGICTSPSTTCPGGGLMPVITTPST